jgi:biopolymer transport protein ExbB
MTRLVAIAVVLGIATPALAQKSGRLEDAYKREYAFLEAEKRALQRRIADEKKAAARRIAAAKSEIAALQGSIVASSNQAEALAEQTLGAERDIEGLDESGDLVNDIALRADTAYDKLSIKLPEADRDKREQLLAQLRFIFESAPGALARLAAVEIRPGVYFDEAGQQVKGDLLHVGAVAAYGLVDGARGVLAPAGEGRLKLWGGEGTSEAAAALASGESLESLPIFLFETLDKGVDKKPTKTLREFINTGGVIGWVIVFLGLGCLAMVALRALLIGLAAAGGRVVRPVIRHIDAGRIARALETARGSRSATGRVLTATLENIDRERGHLEDCVAEAVLAEQPRLSRFGTSILVIAAVSPLLGLLGTVTGMISTFDIITEFGTGNPKLLSGGISEALVTTELGLIVAIPALLLGHILAGFAERVRDNLDAAALSAVNHAGGLRVDEEPEARVHAETSPGRATNMLAADEPTG